MSFKTSCVALLMLLMVLSPVEAEDSYHQIVGTWEVTVNLSEPGLPPSFLALETYNPEGGLITSNNLPFLTRVGQGEWQKNGQQYTVKIKFYKFDPAGLPAGSIVVTHTISLDSKTEYSGVGTAVFCELDGTCQSVGFTSNGRRWN